METSPPPQHTHTHNLLYLGVNDKTIVFQIIMIPIENVFIQIFISFKVSYNYNITTHMLTIFTRSKHKRPKAFDWIYSYVKYLSHKFLMEKFEKFNLIAFSYLFYNPH